MLLAGMLVPVAASCIVLLPQMIEFTEDVQDETALYQLRRIGMMAYDPSVASSSLTFTYRDKEWILHQVNDHLILQPGTQIFLSSIDSASFEERNGVIYIVYQRGNTIRHTPLMHE
jgi:hypothetical protein